MISLSPNKACKTKKVSFCETVRMKRTLHINDYTQREIEATWYSKAEKEHIRREILQTVQLMESGRIADIDDVVYCQRGLEFRTDQGARLRQGNKDLSREAVLDEQDFQECSGYSDIEAIASVYSEISYQCRVAALMMGLSDAKTVERLDLSMCESAKLLDGSRCFGKSTAKRSTIRQMFSVAA